MIHAYSRGDRESSAHVQSLELGEDLSERRDAVVAQVPAIATSHTLVRALSSITTIGESERATRVQDDEIIRAFDRVHEAATQRSHACSRWMSSWRTIECLQHGESGAHARSRVPRLALTELPVEAARVHPRADQARGVLSNSCQILHSNGQIKQHYPYSINKCIMICHSLHQTQRNYRQFHKPALS